MGKPKGEKTASPAEGKIKQVPGAVRKKRKTTFGDSLAATDSKHKFGGSSDKFPKDPSEPKAKQPAKKKKKQPPRRPRRPARRSAWTSTRPGRPPPLTARMMTFPPPPAHAPYSEEDESMSRSCRAQ